MGSPMGFSTKSFLLAVLILLAGCKQAIEMEMDLDNPGSFFTNGFPTDLRVDESGNLDLSLFPRTSHKLTNLYLTEIENRIKGYSTSRPIYLPLTGPLDTQKLSKEDLDYAQPDSPIQLIDIDPLSSEYGKLHPLKIAMTWQKDRYRPNHLLQALPTLGLNLKANNTYALIVTDQVPIKEGNTLVQNPVLRKLLSQEVIGGEVTYKALDVFAPLRDWLYTSELNAENIIAATVWTTGDPTKNLFAGAEAVSQWPSPSAKNLTLIKEFDG